MEVNSPLTKSALDTRGRDSVPKRQMGFLVPLVRRDLGGLSVQGLRFAVTMQRMAPTIIAGVAPCHRGSS